VTIAIDFGFVALTDAAPLIVAKERGLFAKEGLDVALHREVSWATIRDKLAAGLFQGAHMLAPLAIAARIGVGSDPADVIAPLSLNTQSATIGVSTLLAAEMPSASAAGLAQAAAKRLGRGDPQVTFATVFPYSMHSYMLRHWAASAGLDPDRDIRIVTAPPTAIADRLKAGSIDGFCVGAPWGAVCEAESDARIVLDAVDFWPGGPEKVFGLAENWAVREPAVVRAILRSLLHAAVWADAPENVGELSGLLSTAGYLNAPRNLIAKKLGQSERAIRFSRQGASFPKHSHAAWILSQMLRWGQLGVGADTNRGLECYRPDLYSEAAADIGLTATVEMSHDSFFDGLGFDPESLRRYAADFAITRLTD
jgi:ABC-type nitrate/sulfonate/bicarbonate transport system substrate-binding protein